MNQDDTKNTMVASLYRPCAPISAQHMDPAVIMMLPTPINGMFSAIMRCRVGSVVSHPGMSFPRIRKMDVMTTLKRKPITTDLYADILACSG